MRENKKKSDNLKWMENREAIRQERQEFVAESNALARCDDPIIRRAEKDLTITELKLFAYIVSKVSVTDTALKEYKFSVQQFCKVTGSDYENGANYANIKAALKNLHDKSFWQLTPEGDEELWSWIEKPRIKHGSGIITVRLDEDLQKHLIGLKGNYVQYEFLFLIPMRREYSVKLYQLLKSYAFQEYLLIPLEELKDRIGAQTYDRFVDVRRRVLTPAIEEINLFTDLFVQWRPIKYSHAVEEIEFLIDSKDSVARHETERRNHAEIEAKFSGADYYK